jgi:hypothetical protein
MMKYAIAAYRFASAGGTLGYQTLAPTAAKADKMVDEQLAMTIPSDANDFLYQWDASHDYNPSAALEKIEATLLAINAADDERNPPETGVTAAAIKRIRNGRLYLIPASTETRRSSHHRQCGILHRAAQGIAAKRAAAHDLSDAGLSHRINSLTFARRSNFQRASARRLRLNWIDHSSRRANCATQGGSHAKVRAGRPAGLHVGFGRCGVCLRQRSI